MIDPAQSQIQNCEECYKIKCRSCGWEPDDIQLAKVINGEIKVCPTCGKAP